jgi:hypothetical protein
MLGELLSDLPILAPGALVTAANSAAVVYPLAIYFAARFPVVVDVFAAISTSPDLDTLLATLGPLMVGDASGLQSRASGLPLLTAHCTTDLAASAADTLQHRPATSLPEAIRREAAASWIRQSFAHHFTAGDDAADAGGDMQERFAIPFAALLKRLIEAGHALNAILHDVQIGTDGRPVSFRGWTWPQLAYWVRAIDIAGRFDVATVIESSAVAISGVFGEEKGAGMMRDHLRALRTVRN